MAKVAAIAPVLAGISAPAALGIGAALTAGSSLLSAHGQRQHAKRQEAANNQWLAYQNNKNRQFETREDANRKQAQAELDANLANADGESREEVIANESDRLAEDFSSNLPEVADAIRGSGQDSGTSQVFDDALARSVGNATKEAKERMKAMATTMAYGSGSMGGMGMTDMLRNVDTSNTLSGINDQRRGDIGILQRYQQVQPEVLEYQQSPLVPIMNAAGSFFLGGGAQNLGKILGGAAGPGMTTGTGLTVGTPNLLPPTSPGMTFGTGLTAGTPNLLPPSPLAPIGWNGMTSGFA